MYLLVKMCWFRCDHCHRVSQECLIFFFLHIFCVVHIRYKHASMRLTGKMKLECILPFSIILGDKRQYNWFHSPHFHVLIFNRTKGDIFNEPVFILDKYNSSNISHNHTNFSWKWSGKCVISSRGGIIKSNFKRTTR